MRSAWLVLAVAAAGCGPAAKREPPETWPAEWAVIQTWGDGGQPMSDFDKAWIAGEMLPGLHENRPFYDAAHPRRGIIGLHPLSHIEPAKIRFIGEQPPAKPILVVEACGNINGDCVLEGRLDGETIGGHVLRGDRWTTCVFDLKGRRISEADLEIWNVPGGDQAWHFEHCFIDRIYFAAEAPRPADAR